MLGFIKKDFLMVKSNFKIFAIVLVIYGFMAYQNQMDLSFILPFMSIMAMISTFSYDTYNKWDIYAFTLPDGRKNIVRAKYLSTILLVLITTAIITLLSLLISYLSTETLNLEYFMGTIAGNFLAVFLLQIFMYPAIYKFGIEKARIGIFIGVFGIFIIGSIIGNLIDVNPLLEALESLGNYWLIIIPFLTAILLYFSYKISEFFIRNKEY